MEDTNRVGNRTRQTLLMFFIPWPHAWRPACAARRGCFEASEALEAGRGPEQGFEAGRGPTSEALAIPSFPAGRGRGRARQALASSVVAHAHAKSARRTARDVGGRTPDKLASKKTVSEKRPLLVCLWFLMVCLSCCVCLVYTGHTSTETRCGAHGPVAQVATNPRKPADCRNVDRGSCE